MRLRRKKKWIEAIRELYSHYLGHDEGFESAEKDCPFCIIADNLYEDDTSSYRLGKTSCAFCIWIIMDGIECTDYYDEYHFVSGSGYTLEDMRNEREENWTQDAIKRLERWARMLDFPLEGGMDT